MSPEMAIDLVRATLVTALLLAAPLLGAAIVVGLVVSVLQTATGVQEQTLSFVPKLLAVGAVFLIALPWLIGIISAFATRLLSDPAWFAR
jgi:flagellar biosynthetic protein FliQ